MKTGTSISIMAAVMFTIPMPSAPAQGRAPMSRRPLWNYDWLWYIDIMLAVGAALIHMPIKEAPKLRPALAT